MAASMTAAQRNHTHQRPHHNPDPTPIPALPIAGTRKPLSAPKTHPVLTRPTPQPPQKTRTLAQRTLAHTLARTRASMRVRTHASAYEDLRATTAERRRVETDLTALGAMNP